MSGGLNFNNLLNVALQVGLGVVTGGTSMLATAAMTFAKQAITQVFNSVVDSLPIPQALKDAMQMAFAAGIGDYQGLTREASEFIRNAANSDAAGNYTGDFDRSMADLQQVMTSLMLDGIRENASPSGSGRGRGKGGAGGTAGGGGGQGDGVSGGGDIGGTGNVSSTDFLGDGSGESWLVAIAQALGKLAGQRAERMVELLDLAATKTGKDDSQEFSVIMGRFQGEAQMFSLVSNALATVVKAVGEGLSGIARKQ
jgi:hypothetical protein